MKEFNVIVAVDKDNGIGKNGDTPWALQGEMRYFKEITTETCSDSKKNMVIMGRKTWESIPEEFRPLQDRVNVVLTRNEGLQLPPDVIAVSDFDNVLKLLENKELEDSLDKIFIIGGEDVYREVLKLPNCQRIYLTLMDSSFNCDIFFPSFENEFEEISSSAKQKENNLSYFFKIFRKKKPFS